MVAVYRHLRSELGLEFLALVVPRTIPHGPQVLEKQGGGTSVAQLTG